MAEAQDQANSVVQQARSGADFGKLAITYSADQQALKGGQMGWGRIQELPGIFAQALSTAKKRRYRRPDTFRRGLPYPEN